MGPDELLGAQRFQRCGKRPFAGGFQLLRSGGALFSIPIFVDIIPSNGQSQTCSMELVHVVQDRKLGLSDSGARYVTGFLGGGSCEQVPLEINAYQLDAEYTRNPGRRFRVEDRVQAWVEEGRF